MSYNVKITYKGIATSIEQIVAPICRIFEPDGSYIDSAVYTNGHGDNYGKSVYATNVDGFGNIEVKEPYASTSIPFPVPLAQFKLAMLSTQEDGEHHPYIEFTVEDYKEAFYYEEVGAALASQGFVVAVTTAPVSPASVQAVPQNTAKK